MSEGEPKRSWLERGLGIVTEVRAGEGTSALLLALNIFLLLLAYYLIKPVRDALIVAMPSGPEYKSYMGGAVAIALLFAVPAYSKFAQKVPRNRLVVSVTLFFASHLLIFYGLSLLPSSRAWIGLVFYVWVGIFNMMVVAQAWAFAADLYTEEQGGRLFPLIGVGASMGSIAGSLVGVGLKESSDAAESSGSRLFLMLVVAAVFLVAVAGLSEAIHRRESKRQGGKGTPVAATSDKVDQSDRDKAEVPSSEGAFALVLRHKYLTLIAAFSLVFTVVNSNGEYILGVLIKDSALALAEAGDLPVGVSLGGYISGLFSEFYLYVNIAGALLQLFVVSRLIKFVGFRVAFFILPVVAFFDASMMAIVPALAILRIGKTIENSVDYSLNNTLRNMLWLPTTKDMKYRAKQAIDTFFVRMGDVGSALLVAGMVGLAGLGLKTFALTSVAFALAWLVIATLLLRERDKMIGGDSEKRP